MKGAISAFVLMSGLFGWNLGLAVTVNSTADSGAGSLREALAIAAPGDTITFNVSGTITLTSGELLVNKNLTILGPGAANLIIERSSAAPEFRLFNIDGGIVAISGLTLNNGRSAFGGGILNSATLTLSDCAILNSLATVSGGGINNLSTLTLGNCTVAGNAVIGSGVVTGGGIYNEGTVSAWGCNLSSNAVTGFALGGGIHNKGTMTVTNSIINGNSVSGSPDTDGIGGGVNNSGTLTLHTTTVGGNSATGGTNASGVGGGLANSLGTLTLDRSTVSGNVAERGAGTTQFGSAFGGGINNVLGTLTVENSTISGNIARTGPAAPTIGLAQGGGIFNGSGSALLTHSTVVANINSGGAAQEGAGVFNCAGVVAVKNTIIAANIGTSDLFNDSSNLYCVAGSEINSGGFNLFGSINSPIPAGTNDLFNLTPAALRLGPLQDNGGPTFTHALLCGSPAIDAGDNADAPPTDQRGFPRIVNGVIDIGGYELANSLPILACAASTNLGCAPSTGGVATISVAISDAEGDRLLVMWSIDGVASQTNIVPASGLPTNIRLDFTAPFSPGSHQVTITVTDTGGCATSCSTAVSVTSLGDLYPIALSQRTLAGVPIGGTLQDIYNGVQPGNFGWLTWAGSPNEPTIVKSLTPPGNSATYINPRNRSDHTVSVGDWVQGKPGVSNSDQVRKALNTLKQIDITVPVWDQAISQGNNSLYHVVGFAKVRLLSYQLPNQNRITARFLGFTSCE